MRLEVVAKLDHMSISANCLHFLQSLHHFHISLWASCSFLYSDKLHYTGFQCTGMTLIFGSLQFSSKFLQGIPFTLKWNKCTKADQISQVTQSHTCSVSKLHQWICLRIHLLSWRVLLQVVTQRLEWNNWTCQNANRLLIVVFQLISTEWNFCFQAQFSQLLPCLNQFHSKHSSFEETLLSIPQQISST